MKEGRGGGFVFSCLTNRGEMSRKSIHNRWQSQYRWKNNKKRREKKLHVLLKTDYSTWILRAISDPQIWAVHKIKNFQDPACKEIEIYKFRTNKTFPNSYIKICKDPSLALSIYLSLSLSLNLSQSLFLFMWSWNVVI